jgi:glycosyltransferase involved in cell wall biosynthesis
MGLAIFIPAYQAEMTLGPVVRRIPQDVYAEMSELLIQDDASSDGTYQVACDLQREFPKITVVRNEVNHGYGGTKKKAYRYLAAVGADPIVLLHGDGQHAPEALPAMLQPIRAGHADVVLGSRMLGSPLKGRMPSYKFIGNVALTAAINWAAGVRLTDPHTGFRVYSLRALKEIGFESCGDGHEISAQSIFRAAARKLRIQEVPVDTIYSAESRQCSFRTSVSYGIDVLRLAAGARAGRRRVELKGSL